MTLDEFFSGFEESRRLFDCVYKALDAGGSFELRITKSQISFKAGKPFAWAWIPGRYLKSTIPLVLSVSLPGRDASPRWKQIVEPAKGRFMHHLEIRTIADIDEEVFTWLEQARAFAAK